MSTQSVTKPIALDETLQTTNSKLESVATKLQGIIDALSGGGGGGGGDSLVFKKCFISNDAQILQYTETVTEKTQFLIFGTAGDSNGTFTTDGTILLSQAIDGRVGFFYIVDCEAGDSISIEVANQSGSSYYGSNLVVLKCLNKIIKTAYKAYNNTRRDGSTGTYTDVLDNEKEYILIGTTCGSSRSVSYSIDNISDSSFMYNNSCFIVFLSKKLIHLSMSAYGTTAGGGTIFVIEVTTDTPS